MGYQNLRNDALNVFIGLRVKSLLNSLKLTGICIFALLLSGCVAVALVGAAGGLVVYDKRSLRMIERDTRIAYIINKTIVDDPSFRDSHIVVSSFNETVLLAGQTPAASLRVTAEKIAQKTPNVKRVYNQVTIGNPISLSQQSKDTWITGQVRANLLTKKGLESGSIRVVTEDAVVYLMGIVTKEQAQLAVDVARNIEGVRKVVKVFRYII